MKSLTALLLMLMMAVSVNAENFNFSPISNEVSYYKNADDDMNDLGETLQVVSINSFKTLTWFNFEFTGDFNWGMTDIKNYDYYIELSLVKPVTSHISLNYQRIYGTFVTEPVNQFGIRLSL